MGKNRRGVRDGSGPYKGSRKAGSKGRRGGPYADGRKR